MRRSPHDHLASDQARVGATAPNYRLERWTRFCRRISQRSLAVPVSRYATSSIGGAGGSSPSSSSARRAATTFGSKYLPLSFLISARARSRGQASLYGLVLVKASNTSAT